MPTYLTTVAWKENTIYCSQIFCFFLLNLCYFLVLFGFFVWFGFVLFWVFLFILIILHGLLFCFWFFVGWFLNYIAWLTWSALQTTVNSHGILGQSYPHDWLTFCIYAAAVSAYIQASKFGTTSFVVALKCHPFFPPNFFQYVRWVHILTDLCFVLEGLDSSSVMYN